MRFIELNLASASDEHQHSPIGFDIIFSGMLEYATELNLNLHLDSGMLTTLLHKRDFELRRYLSAMSYCGCIIHLHFLSFENFLSP